MQNDRMLQGAKSVGMGAILAANLLVFVPVALYLGNIEEFVSPLSSVLAVNLQLAALLALICALIGMLFSRALFPRYLVFLAAAAILVWVQGNLLVWDYGLLDGRTIDWDEGSWRGWLDLSLWLGVLGTGIYYADRIAPLAVRAATVLFALQLGWTSLSLVQNSAGLAGKTVTSTDSGALTELYRFSSGQNVLHIIADGFQTDVFEEILTDPVEGADFAEALDGFVFFREHMGVFPLTHMTVPAILSGKIYRNHVPREAFLDETIGGKSILNEAHATGYEVDLAVPVSLSHMYGRSRATNLHLLANSGHMTESDYVAFDAFRLVDLTLFRALPHLLKRYVYNDQLWLMQSLLHDEEYKALQFFSHTAFLRQLHENMHVDREAPVYKFIHVMLSHNPMVTDNNCNYAGGVLPTIRPTVKAQAKCGLSEITLLLQRMKDLGIYDDATIVLMGDHGAWVRPNGFKEGDDRAIVKKPSTVAQAYPLMAIKRPGANEPIQASEALSWIVDTPETIASILQLDARFAGRSIFDLAEQEPRERRYHVYQYSREEWHAEYLAPIHEFIIDGSVLDTMAWRRGEVFEPMGGKDRAITPTPSRP